MEILSLIFEKTVLEIYEAVDENGNLISQKFAAHESLGPPYYEATPMLTAVFEYGKIRDMPAGLVKKVSVPTFPMESFPLPQSEIRLMSSLLARD